MNHLTSDQIQDFIDGVISNEAELHLRQCSPCQSKMRAYKKLDRTLRSVPLDEPPQNFTQRVMQQVGVRQLPSFSWTLFKNLAPLFALTLVAGIAFVALRMAGVFEGTEVQQSTNAAQTIYDQVGRSVSGGVQAFNGWMAKYFSFAFAKSSYGLTAFILIFFGVIALLDKYLIMPMMKRKAT